MEVHMTNALATVPARPEQPAALRDPRSFVRSEVWERQIKLLTRDHPWDTVMAERVFGQAVAYLITAMESWDEKLEIGCGPVVDIGVHGFILDTRNYRAFCAGHLLPLSTH
jgi:hypothetical protein